MTASTNLLARIARLFMRRRQPAVAVVEQEMARPLIVVVAALAGDVEGQAAAALRQTLEGRKGLVVRQSTIGIAVEGPPGPGTLGLTMIKARQVLADEAADLVIWGTAGKATNLHLTPLSDEDQRPSLLQMDHRVALSTAFDGPAADVLHAAILAAVAAHGEQRRLISEELPRAAAACEAVTRRFPVAFSPRAQMTALATFGHAAMAMAGIEPEADWPRRAEAAFATALKRLPARDLDPVEEAALLRQRASALSMIAERTGAEADHEAAIAATRDVLDALPKALFPAEWAAEQNRLGLALYRFDLKTGRTDLLKEAIGCFQAALQEVSRSEQPRRWADIMETLAQALQVYGDATHNVEILDKAVAACRAVLEARTRDGNPLAWAATMNTLGSALFLRDKHADESDSLDEAADCLRQAAEVYRNLGLGRQSGLAEKNMSHVERLAKSRRERKARFDWNEE